ncbi:MAG: class I SAM-dependent methyltransferase [Pseudomonadota bacterium]
MTFDPATIDFYDKNAEAYANRFSKSEADRHLSGFLDEVAKGGRILDLGAGPGNAAAYMISVGFRAEAWDASEGMVRLARENFGVPSLQATFHDLTAEAEYDGIWANFSLLHARREDMGQHLAAIHRALKPGGVFHIGMKLGEGVARDRLERSYTYFTDDELLGLMDAAGFEVTFKEYGESEGMANTYDAFLIVRARA